MKKLSFLSLVVLCVTLPGCLSTTPSSGTIGVNPDSVTVAAGTSQLFQPILTGSLSTADIKWVVTGNGCSSGSCGSIDINGIYTAPKTAPANPNIQVEAIDIFDPSKSGIANVMIGPAATIAITQPAANPSTVASTNTLVFAAKVSNTSNSAVNWTVAGAGCSGAACGMFSVSQTTNTTTTTYKAPNPLPGPPTVTVTATSAADPTQTATLTVNLTLLVGLNPGSVTVGVLDTQAIQANITGAQNSPAAAITWTLSSPNANCSAVGNPCGTITPQPNNQATYQAPAATTASPVTVTAAVSQAVTNGPLNGVGTSTIALTTGAGGANSQLFDHYAFIYRGYSLSNTGAVSPFVEAGSLIFDGNGNIVSGSVEDDNASGTTPHRSAIMGTYSFDSSDNTRGTITINSGGNGLGLVTSMRFVLVPNGAAVATTVFLTDIGGVNAGAGRMVQQDKTQFSNAALAGGTAAWAMQMRGNNNAPSAVGRFDVQNGGTNTINAELGRAFDTSTPGAFGDCNTTQTITIPAFSNTSTGAISAVDSSGNATLTLSNVSIRGGAAISPTFSVYIVSATRLFLVENDSAGFGFLGTAEQQSKTNFSNADFNGVYDQLLYSVNGPGAGNTDLTISEGPGTNSSGTIPGVDMEWGGNLDGTFAEAGFDSFGYYSVQPNGMSLYTGCTGLFIARYVVYFVSPSRAFLWNIVSDIGTTPFAADTIGEMDLQQVQPPNNPPANFGGSTTTFAVSFEGIEGNFVAPDTHTATDAIAASGVVQFDYNGAGTVQFILDVSRGASNTGTAPITITGTYSLTCTITAPPNLTDQGCEPPDDNFFAWGGITSSSFSGTPPFTFSVPNHFWVVSSNLILFSFTDNVGGTFPSNISGLAVKNQ